MRNVYKARAASQWGLFPSGSSQLCSKRPKLNSGKVSEAKYCRRQNPSPWHSAGKQYKKHNVQPSFHQECNTIAKLQFCQSNEHVKSFVSYFQTFIIKPFLNNPITEVCIYSQVIRPTNLERPPMLVYLTGCIPASFKPTGICSQIYSWQTTSLNISSSSTELFNIYL